MLDLPDKRDLADIPLIRVVALAYAALSVLIIPLCFIVVAVTIPAQVRGFRAATNPYEKTYWRLNIVGHSLITYGAVVMALLMTEGFCIDSWKLSDWWPNLSWYWYGTDTYGTRNNMHNVILNNLVNYRYKP